MVLVAASENFETLEFWEMDPTSAAYNWKTDRIRSDDVRSSWATSVRVISKFSIKLPPLVYRLSNLQQIY